MNTKEDKNSGSLIGSLLSLPGDWIQAGLTAVQVLTQRVLARNKEEIFSEHKELRELVDRLDILEQAQLVDALNEHLSSTENRENGKSIIAQMASEKIKAAFERDMSAFYQQPNANTNPFAEAEKKILSEWMKEQLIQENFKEIQTIMQKKNLRPTDILQLPSNEARVKQLFTEALEKGEKNREPSGNLSEQALNSLSNLMCNDTLTLALLKEVARTGTAEDLKFLEKKVPLMLYDYPFLFKKLLESNKGSNYDVLIRVIDRKPLTNLEPQNELHQESVKILLSHATDIYSKMDLARELSELCKNNPPKFAADFVRGYADNLDLSNKNILTALLGLDGPDSITSRKVRDLRDGITNAAQETVLFHLKSFLAPLDRHIQILEAKAAIDKAMNAFEAKNTDYEKDTKYIMMKNINDKLLSTTLPTLEQIGAWVKEFSEVASMRRGFSEPEYAKEFKNNPDIQKILNESKPEIDPDPVLQAMKDAISAALQKKHTGFKAIKEKFQMWGSTREEKIQEMKLALSCYQNAKSVDGKFEAASRFHEAANRQRGLIKGELPYTAKFNEEYDKLLHNKTSPRPGMK